MCNHPNSAGSLCQLDTVGESTGECSKITIKI